MSKPTKTDLPGTDLLFGSHVKKTESVAEAAPVVTPVSEPAVVSSKAVTKPVVTESADPVKFTFYFDPQILEDLEVAKFRLRMEKRVRVSKSDIVNKALEYCMKDLNFLERMVKGELN